jgi:hypothetical protein
MIMGFDDKFVYLSRCLFLKARLQADRPMRPATGVYFVLEPMAKAWQNLSRNEQEIYQTGSLFKMY